MSVQTSSQTSSQSSSQTNCSDNMITLISSEGVEININKKAAMIMKTIESALEDSTTDLHLIPIGNIEEPILRKIVEYAEYIYLNDSKQTKNDPERETYINNYLNIEHQELYKLIEGANFLNFTELLDLACENIASQIRGKSVEEIRTHFKIKNDFTPEDEEKLKKEFEWCQEAFKSQ
jgi:S-phase kinase-associated protein 1